MTEQIQRPFYKDYAWQALRQFGEETQWNMIIEEGLEFLLAVQDYRRGVKQNTREHLIEELADLLLVTDQLREMVLIKEDELEKKRREKIVRLMTRIDKETEDE